MKTDTNKPEWLLPEVKKVIFNDDDFLEIVKNYLTNNSNYLKQKVALAVNDDQKTLDWSYRKYCYLREKITDVIIDNLEWEDPLRGIKESSKIVNVKLEKYGIKRWHYSGYDYECFSWLFEIIDEGLEGLIKTGFNIKTFQDYMDKRVVKDTKRYRELRIEIRVDHIRKECSDIRWWTKKGLQKETNSLFLRNPDRIRKLLCDWDERIMQAGGYHWEEANKLWKPISI